MPRRAYWEAGQLNDKHITEADLSQALQTKVNGGGGGGSGNIETILDTTVVSNSISHSFNFDRNIDMDGSDIGLIKVIISNIVLSADEVVKVSFNGQGSGGLITKGLTSDGTTVTFFNDISGAISDGETFADNGSGSIIIEIPGDIFDSGTNMGGFGRWADQAHYSSGQVDFQTSAFDPLVSVQVFTTTSATINTGTKVTAYAYNKD